MKPGGWCCIREGCISRSRTPDEHGPLVDLGHERPQVPARARNLSPIVPRASIAGRALVAVVARMTYLADSALVVDDLPVPRVIVARVQAGTVLDLAALRTKVTQAAPSASVDDHRAWI